MTALFVGLSTLDIQYFTDEFPSSNMKIKTAEPDLLVGGPATNAAVAYSFLGGKSVLVSGVGNSPFRQIFIDDFQNNQIEHVDLYRESIQLPVLASVITSTKNGDRTIFTHNPADDVQLNAKAIFDRYQPEIVMVDGFYPKVANAVCLEAKKRGVKVVFDGGSWKTHLPPLLENIDYAICSAHFYPSECTCSADVFQFLKNAGVQFNAITQGNEPILFEDSEKICEVPVKSIKAIDTLGAGDFFHGAFCYHIARQNSFEAALKKASLLATKTCEYEGTRKWLMKEDKNTFL